MDSFGESYDSLFDFDELKEHLSQIDLQQYHDFLSLSQDTKSFLSTGGPPPPIQFQVSEVQGPKQNNQVSI